MENKRMYKCMCNWAECSDWTNALASSKDHQYLGSIARLRYATLQENIHRLALEVDVKRKQKLSKKVLLLTKYCKVVLKHLAVKRPSSFSHSGDIFIARHHFPHSYLRTTANCVYSAPISEDLAHTLDIGTLPRDRANVANEENRQYFLVPNVTKSVVKSLLDMIVHGKGLDRKYRTRNRFLFQTPPAKMPLTALKLSTAIQDESCASSNIMIPEVTPPVHNSLMMQNPDDNAIAATNLHLEENDESTKKNFNVNSYILPMTELFQIITCMVQAAIESGNTGLDGSSQHVMSGQSLTKHLNGEMAKNIHYSNIVTLLSNFHRCTETIRLTTRPIVYLLWCVGSGDSNSPSDGNTKCTKAILSLRLGNKAKCTVCEYRKRNDNKIILKKQKNGHKRTMPESRCPITALSPDSRKKRLISRRQQKFKLKARLRKVMEENERFLLKSTNEVEGDIIRIMRSVGNVSKDITTRYKNDLVDGIVKEMESSNDGMSTGDKVQKREEIETFVSETVERIINYKKVLNGKQSQVRFSPREIRMAMTIYNRSPAGYRDFANSSIQILPSLRLLKDYRSRLKVSDGEQPLLFGTLRDRLKILKIDDCYGILMLDEMKLKHDIYCNMITGEIIGLASDDENFTSVRDDVRGIIRSLLKANECKNADTEGGRTEAQNTSEPDKDISKNEDSDLDPVSYVNQYRFRSSKNRTSNVEFFFNKGSLTGNEIMYQLFHVLAMFNIVNIHIVGVCLDAGGNNSRLLSLLRHGKPLGNDAWIDDKNLVTFRDPTACHNETERRISTFHCSTHNQKAHRNAFLLSNDTPKSSRYFLSKDGVRFTWNDCVQECYLRDSITPKPSTSLNRSSVYPNAWNKMCVSYSLSPFSEKTLNEQFVHLGSYFGCSDKMYWKGNYSHSSDLPAMYKKRLEILNEAEFDALANGTEVDEQIKCQLKGLEYSIYVAQIFNLCFMNKEMNVTNDNINQLESQMRECLQYFATWRKSAMARKKIDKEWEKGCVSAQTFNNLRIQVVGFFHFARYILKADDSIMFVPFLFSNQSSLESHFSQMRSKGADTPQKYIAASICNNVTDVNKGLANNKWYENMVDANERQVTFTSMEKATGTSLSFRLNQIDKIVASAKLARQRTLQQQNIPSMDENAFRSYSSTFKNQKCSDCFDKIQIGFDKVVDRIQRRTVSSNYIDTLLEVTNLKDCAVDAYNSGSPASGWFSKLLGISDSDQVKQFDKACQFAVAKILVLFRDTCLVGERSKDSSLWYQIYLSIDSGEMFGNRGPFKSVLELLPFNQSAMYVILEKIVQLVESWTYEVELPNEDLDHPSSNRYNPQMMSSATNELQKEKVNGFFGYAIAMVIQKFDCNKRKVEYVNDEKEIAELNDICLYLRNMRILHKHAITDSNYMKHCYSKNDIMLNRGGLTLVAPHYFQFAIELVGLIDEEISEQKIYKRKGDSYNLATENINLRRSELQSKFENCAKSSHAMSGYTVGVDRISQVVKDKIFDDILKKTFRSMFNCALKTVRENTTGNYAKSSSKETHREKLKHDIAKRQMKVDGVKAEKAIQLKKEGKTGE